MTRVMYWNVQDFGLNKIADPSDDIYYADVSRSEAAQKRRRYILRHFDIDPVPEIFVLIEAESAPFYGRGQLRQTAGYHGAYQLLAYIRGKTGNTNWMLVPPLQTGPTESVAVFFDSTNLVFTGPNRWPGGVGPSNTAANIALPAHYIAQADRYLPNRLNIPAGAQYNTGQSERICAARCEFQWGENSPLINFVGGAQIDFEDQRAPYMVSFAEVDAANVVQRNISLFAIHSPAGHTARDYLRRLPQIEEIADDLDNEEVRVIVGDFNHNLMNDDLELRESYALMENIDEGEGYTLGLKPEDPPPDDPEGYEGYYATHMKPVTVPGPYGPVISAKFWSTIANNSYYPGYGYIGASQGGTLYAIDNIFTWYGNNQHPPAANNMSIINGVVGSPFDVVNPAYGGAPEGSVPWPCRLGNRPAAYPWAVAPQHSLALVTKMLVRWDNYPSIRNTSDHMALVIDI